MKISSAANYALGFILSYEASMEIKKDELCVRWIESRNFPRKKKKKERKDLIETWNIISWNPFNNKF